MLSVTGPSGAGKSSLLWALARALRPAAASVTGTVRVDGPCWTDREGAARAGVVLVPQGNGLGGNLSAEESILVPLLALGVPAREALAPRRRLARPRRPGGVRPSPRRPALRRPAAAGGAGPGLRPAAGGAARGRVDQRPGRRQPWADDRCPARGGRSRRLGRPRHPRPRGRRRDRRARSRSTRAWPRGSARSELARSGDPEPGPPARASHRVGRNVVLPGLHVVPVPGHDCRGSVRALRAGPVATPSPEYSTHHRTHRVLPRWRSIRVAVDDTTHSTSTGSRGHSSSSPEGSVSCSGGCTSTS